LIFPRNYFLHFLLEVQSLHKSINYSRTLKVKAKYFFKTSALTNITYLLTPWSRVLLEKLTGFAASQEIPRIYGTRKFITVLTSVRHLSLSWARSIQFPQSPPTSWRSLNHLLLLPKNLLLRILNFKHCKTFNDVFYWQFCKSVTLARITIGSLKMVQMDRNM
jgi:hypothetical protein